MNKMSRISDIAKREKVIRVHDWNDHGDLLRYLYNHGKEYEPLLFGCISVSPFDFAMIQRKGFTVDEMDYENILRDKRAQKEYMVFLQRLHGFPS